MKTLERRAKAGRIGRTALEQRVRAALSREHLADFVVAEVGGEEASPTFTWRVDTRLRSRLEKTRLGRRVICSDCHDWSTERIVRAFRGQWNVEELFRRTKKGGVSAWGPSYQWADGSLRLHTFATVIGLMLVSLAKLAMKVEGSARAFMSNLAGISATLLRVSTGKPGRRPTVTVAPSLTPSQRKAVKVFELARWLPALSSSRTARPRKERRHAQFVLQ